VTGRPRVVRYGGVTALVAAIILAAGIVQTNLGHTILRKAGVTGGPTGYTSLAFSHPQSLPKQLRPKPANVEVSFVIQNTGDAPRDYQWSVSLAQGQRRHDVGTGRVRIAAGHGATITRSAKSSCTQGQIRIVVSLAEPAESIGAWIACSRSSSSESAAAQLNWPLPRSSS
jgi:hypothetical protein